MSYPLYTDFSAFLSKHFDGKVQKLSINAGFTCPNRDGTLGRGGCTYCNNRTFNPDYCGNFGSVTEQLEKGKQFFAKKYPEMKYLAYFQAYTNTYGELSRLRSLYEEALKVKDVVGLVVGTRPDCMPEDLLDYFTELNKKTFVLIEYGVETAHNKTLERINRGHTFECSAEAIRKTSERGIPVGAHLILGLPGETRKDILESAKAISQLPLDTLKLHQLQLVRGTQMASEFLKDPSDFHIYTAEEYAELVVDFMELVRPEISIERFTSQSPKELLIAPDWGLKNYQFVELVKRALVRRNTCQGRLC